MSITRDELRKKLGKIKAMRKGMPVGETEADYAWQKKIEAVSDLFLDWLDYVIS